MVTDAPSAQTTDRMQALLSRAVEEQVSEQRAVSQVLHELREQLKVLEAGLRKAASNDAVEQLDAAITAVVGDQRTATTLLSQRLEVLSTRVEALGALTGDVEVQTAALDRVSESLQRFGSFPGALSALQQDVAGMHDRLAPLGELQASVGDLTATATGGLEALRQQLAGLESRLAAQPGSDRLRDAVVEALTSRLDRLQESAERDVVGPDALRRDLGDLRAALTGQIGSHLEPVQEAIEALEGRVVQLAERVASLDTGAVGVERLAEVVAELGRSVAALSVLPARLEGVAADTRALRADDTGTATTAALEALAADLAQLAEQTRRPPVVAVDELSAQVGVRVADRLVETLAPRIADVVLTRVSAALVTELGATLSQRLATELDARVRAATAESEQRVLAHIDEGLLTLAEALLRRKPAKRAAKATPEPLPTEPVHEVLEALAAEAPAEPTQAAEPVKPPASAPPADPRPAVTTGMAPTPARAVIESAAAAEPAVAKPTAKAETDAEPPTARAKPAAKATPRATPAKEESAPVRKAAPIPRNGGPVRPARPRPRPLLERTPDLEDDAPPLRPVPPRPTPPAAAPPAPPAAPPPPPPAPTRASAAAVPDKRKPWWRPGG